MPTNYDCPDEVTLRTILNDVSGEAEIEELAHHIDHCRDCQNLVEQLGQESGNALSWDSFDFTQSSASPCDAVVERLVRIVRGETLNESVDETMPEMPLPDRLEHFEIEGAIGQGGMGTVYKARDTRLNRYVALKQLRPILAWNNEIRRRILSEAQAAAAINHPGVVSIHSVHADHDPAFFVMEYVEGPSLQHVLHERPQLPVEEAVAIAEQILHAIAAAHERNVVHCDIKPANILLDRNSETARLTDFGISYAASRDETAHPEKYLGTPRYMSPEQCQGLQVDARSDLFSLGVLMYRMLTGSYPFLGETADALKTNIQQAPPVPIQSHSPELPRRLARLVHRLIAKDPQDRPQSAAEVLHTLASWQQKRQRTTKSAIGIGIAVSLLIGASYLVNRRNQPRQLTQHSLPARNVSPIEKPAARPIELVPPPEAAPYYQGLAAPSLKLLDPDPSIKLEFVDPAWRLVESFRVNGKVRSAKFSPFDGSIWFCYIGLEGPRGIYRIGPLSPPREYSRNRPLQPVSPSPEQWQSTGQARLIQAASETHHVEFSPNGRYFAFHFGRDGLVVLNETATGEQVGGYQCRLDQDNDPAAITFLPRFYQGEIGSVGDILTVDFGYPSYPGSIWKCTLNSASCVEIGEPERLTNPTDITVTPTKVYVCQRATETEKGPRHESHRNNRIFEVLPNRLIPIHTDRHLRLVEGIVYDPVSEGLLATTRFRSLLWWVDVNSDSPEKKTRLIAKGFKEPRSDGLDITPDGRYVLVSDFTAGTIHVLERQQ